MTTKPVTMWGLFWKGTNTLSHPRLYRTKSAASNSLPYRRDDDWRALKTAEKYDRMGWECRPVFTFEFSENQP